MFSISLVNCFFLHTLFTQLHHATHSSLHNTFFITQHIRHNTFILSHNFTTQFHHTTFTTQHSPHNIPTTLPPTTLPPLPPPLHTCSPGRLNATLAVSRGFGDLPHKKLLTDVLPHARRDEQMKSALLACPEVLRFQRKEYVWCVVWVVVVV